MEGLMLGNVEEGWKPGDETINNSSMMCHGLLSVQHLTSCQAIWLPHALGCQKQNYGGEHTVNSA